MCARCVAGCNKQREREFKRDNKNEMLRSPLQNLRNQGMKPELMGDFPAGGDLPGPGSRRQRPYLVK